MPAKKWLLQWFTIGCLQLMFVNFFALNLFTFFMLQKLVLISCLNGKSMSSEMSIKIVFKSHPHWSISLVGNIHSNVLTDGITEIIFLFENINENQRRSQFINVLWELKNVHHFPWLLLIHNSNIKKELWIHLYMTWNIKWNEHREFFATNNLKKLL